MGNSIKSTITTILKYTGLIGIVVGLIIISGYIIYKIFKKNDNKNENKNKNTDDNEDRQCLNQNRGKVKNNI